MLASDANNPEFSNPTNPDAALSVQFYIRPVKNEFKSEQEQRPIFEDVVFVKIFTPGNSLNIIDRPAWDVDKKRFPMHWAHFQNTQGDSREIGTPLSQWSLLSPSQVEELKALKFYTVDSVANASDQHISNIGMLGGMSPISFRERARHFLAAAKDTAAVHHAEEKAKKLEEENAAIKRQMQEIQEQMAELMQHKRGRKPKVEETAE